MPKCCKLVPKITRKQRWAKSAVKVEPFVLDKIRRKIFENYRHKNTNKLDDLRNEIAEELLLSGIEFKPSKSTFDNVLKAMGFRHGKIRNDPQIHEKPAIRHWRALALRYLTNY